MTIKVDEAKRLSSVSLHRKPWHYFDAEYYRKQCFDSGLSLSLNYPKLEYEHYVHTGARQGLSPNPFFDEAYYLNRYPDVKSSVEQGKWQCGFDHFIGPGTEQEFSPIWYFDPYLYKSLYDDMTATNLRAGGFSDLYTHFLLVGLSEGRVGSWLLQAVCLMKEVPWYKEFSTLQSALATSSLDLSSFSPAFEFSWIIEKYNLAKTSTDINVLMFYVKHVKQGRLSPSAYFDEPFYLLSNPEIAEAVENGMFSCGYEHFILHGCGEGRAPFPSFNSKYYLAANIGVAAECRRKGLSAFAHYLKFGRKRRLLIDIPMGEREVFEAQGKGIYERRCALSAEALPSLSFCDSGEVDISVIVIARDKFLETANCLVTLAASTNLRTQVIVYDNGSTDPISALPQINPTITYIRSEKNIGFTLAVNEASKLVRAPIMVLLNNDTELNIRSIDYGLETLLSSEEVGIVGGKIVRMHGRAQEAGSIIWKDGSCLGYGRDRDPIGGDLNFNCDVDFCSGCLLILRSADWNALEGFDEAYAPAYYEETDLCVRMWQLGKRVVYDPRVVLWHFEFGSSAIAEEALVLMRRNQRYFALKHRAYLSNCYAAAPSKIEAARLRHVTGPKILLIEDKLPDTTAGMGFVRSARIADVLSTSAGHVSVVGLHGNFNSASDFKSRINKRTEVLRDINADNIDKLFNSREGVYDIVWLSRVHNLRLLKTWKSAHGEFFKSLKIVLDTEAIASARQAKYAELAGRAVEFDKMLMTEFDGLELVDQICVVNELDRGFVEQAMDKLGLSIDVAILGHAIEPRPVELNVIGKAILIVGSFVDFESPNADAFIWFDRHVRPLLLDKIEAEIIVAGNGAADFLRKLDVAGNYQIVDRPKNMEEVYARSRVMVACTRFAGGIPFKVHEAASYGIPVVMSTILSDQLGWSAEPHIRAVPLVAEEFAEQTASLYLDQESWLATRSRQLRLIEDDCSPAYFSDVIRKLIEVQRSH